MHIVEKKRHTRKALILKDENRKIVYVSRLFDGKIHDYQMLKTSFPPSSDCFENVELNLDLGFIGIASDYKVGKLKIPHKRKRVKDGVSNELEPEQKEYNKKVSSERVDIEHSIGQMKVCRAIHQVVRIRDRSVLDDIVLVAAGLANFKNSK